MNERAVPPSETPEKPRLARRSLQLGIVATLVALLPLALLARLTTARTQDSVRDEVTLVRECRPDLILLDLRLPGIDGDEVLRRLRADQRTADVPVVMVPADVTPWRRERLLEAGAAEYLTKPLDVPRFLDVIDGILVAAHP